MKAAQIQSPGCIDIIDTNIPDPSENQVRIKLEGCGVCGSNLPVYEGREWFKYPITPGNPGHEGWGVVDAKGKNVKKLNEGDRVTMLSYNAFAEYDVADEGSVIKIPDELINRPFPGEPLGCVMNIFNRSGINKGDTVAIIGIGFLGALLTQLAVNSGSQVIAISRRDYSLDIAKKMGAQNLIKMDDHWRIIEEVKNLTDGRFCSKVIEAVGMQWPVDLAGELTSERGRLIIAGYHQDGPRSVNMQLWNWRGIDVINAHEREQQVYINGIMNAAEAVSNRILTPDKLYSEFSFDNISDAFKTAVERPDGFVKAIINFN
jgi:threonine dehydrogenase-like Zn-dependent dehydrogenase